MSLMGVVNSAVSAMLLWGIGMVFFWPLEHGDDMRLRSTLWLVLGMLMLSGATIFLPLRWVSGLMVLLQPFYLWGMGATLTRSKPAVTLYFSIWSIFVYTILGEISYILVLFLRVASVYRVLIWLPLAAVACLVLEKTLSIWMPVYQKQNMGPRQLGSAIGLYLIFGWFSIKISEVGWYNLRNGNALLMVLCQIYCLTIIYLQTALFQKSAIRQELQTMNLMWHQQEAQYIQSKENIALINRKCHDLKHQVAAMRTMESSERREQYIREIEDSVRIYESHVRTGNDTLDTVLTEKSLQCEAKEITVNCVADGARLDFMDPVDIYTVMGNALDNAIEAVQVFEQKELRVIDVLIHVRQKFLVVCVTNPLKGQLTFEEGLPVSIKPKNGYHGFGVRSIRHTVQKYGGQMTVETQDGCFALRILLPLKEEKETAA